MPSNATGNESKLIAELDGLVQVDHYAAQAYTGATKSLHNERYSPHLRELRCDVAHSGVADASRGAFGWAGRLEGLPRSSACR